MTRINCVPPKELSRQHLLAEYRELPRVFKLAAEAFRRDTKVVAPAQYTLGAGHVKFFYSRLAYCAARFQALRTEMLCRGYKPHYDHPPLVNVGQEWWQDWLPTAAALDVNRRRILERTIQK